MKKRISRWDNTIICELYKVHHTFSSDIEIVMVTKYFNDWKGSLFGIEPTQKTYDKANKWADKVIQLQLKNENN